MGQASFFIIMEGFTKATLLTTLRMARAMKNFLTDRNTRGTFKKGSNRGKDSSNGRTVKYMKGSLAMVLSMALEFGLPLINKVTSANGPMAKSKVLEYTSISMEIVMRANLRTPRNQVQALKDFIMAKPMLVSIAKIVPTALDNTFGLMAVITKVSS